jgi:TRAP transporter TAXI family solute receptor
MIQLFIFIFLLATYLYYLKDKITETFINQYQLYAPTIITEKSIIHTAPTILINDYDNLSKQLVLYFKERMGIPITPLQNQDNPIYNMNTLNNKKVDLFITPEEFYINASQGKDIFKIKHQNLRFVSGLYYEVFLLITYPESGINEWKDLKGKILGMSSVNSGSFHNGFKLAQVVGLTPGQDFQYLNVNSMNRLANLLLEKKVDAIYLTTTNKNPYLINLAQRMSLRFIGTSEMNQQILKKYFPYAVEKYINTNTFYTNINTSSFIKCYAIRSVLIAHKDVPSDYIYNLTQKLFQNSESLKIFFNNYLYNRDKLNLVKDAFIPLEMSYLNKLMDYHVGAEQYYYEFGYLTKKVGCDKYVGQNIFECPSEIQLEPHLLDQ